MPRVVCELEQACVSLPAKEAYKEVLHDVSWRIEAGQHTVLVGVNGAGKTTLLRLLSGELWSSKGRIAWLDGDELSPSRICGQALTAMVSPALQERFQSYAWDITGRDLLLTGFDGTPLLYTTPDAKRIEMVEEIAEALDAKNLLHRSTLEMSQGQLRLMLLGRALVRRPLLLLLDECTDGLDEKHRLLFYKALEHAASACTVIMATHRESQIPEWLTNRRYIHAGRLSLTPQAMSQELDLGAIAHTAHVKASIGQCLIDVENATVYIHGKKVLHDLNWQLHSGECWLLEGGNGAGKSTFLRMLAGDENVAWPGRIRFHLPSGDLDEIPFVTLRKRVRLVSDLSQAFYGYDLTALELVLSGFDNTVGLYRDFTDAEKEEAKTQLTRVGLQAFVHTSIRQLSTGQLRKLFLARALVGEPLLLLLDEPCTGLDEVSRTDYIASLDKLAMEGLSYLFVSHYREDIPASINRVARMQAGRLVVD